MVGNRDNQYNVLLEAVQNHTPEVLVVDEIGTKPEVAAIRTIAERGVTMVRMDGIRSYKDIYTVTNLLLEEKNTVPSL